MRLGVALGADFAVRPAYRVLRGLLRAALHIQLILYELNSESSRYSPGAIQKTDSQTSFVRLLSGRGV
jgi:hypothetical protein